MARNEQKAQAMLNRWWEMKKSLHNKPMGARPRSKYAISQVTSLAEADKWRNSILKDINKKVIIIQNAGLGQHKIRELNDLINNLLKEQKLWEERIFELGGPNHREISQNIINLDGQKLSSSEDYLYFGAAKDLPGVRELFERELPEAPQKNRKQIFRDIDLNKYYGQTDDTNQILLKGERAAEELFQQRQIDKWRVTHIDYLKLKYKEKHTELTDQDIFTLIEEENNQDQKTVEDEIDIEAEKQENEINAILQQEQLIQQKKELLSLLEQMTQSDQNSKPDKQNGNDDDDEQEMIQDMIMMN